MPFENFFDKKVYFQEEGLHQPGIPLLLIHGAGNNHKIWKLQIEALGKNRPVIAIDLPGHNQSEGPAYSSIEEYTEWTISFIEHYFGNGRFAIAGHSMGGAITQQIAMSGTKIVGALLITTGSKLSSNPKRLEKLQKGIYDRDDFLTGFSPKTSEEIIASVEMDRALTSLESALQDYTACSVFDIRSKISDINIPIMIIAGADDLRTPPAFSTYMHEAIPGASLAIIPDAGHYVMQESPKQFLELVQNFLIELDKRG